MLHLPIPDTELEDGEPPYFHPGMASPEVAYLRDRRAALGGTLPLRHMQAVVPELPADLEFAEFAEGTTQEVSTTMAFVRILRKLVRHPGFGPRVVPIVADEARTFGMESLFSDQGIYASRGQLYEPADHNLILRYKETRDGQILEEGITEAGSLASFTAVGTSYATHGVVTMPFFIFYSMFGFQRVGDLAWAFGDARGRGFLVGATAGRTTLQGEGLQHDDGHSQVLASVIPNLRAYDPAYAYELAVIIKDGLRRMAGSQEDCFYYVTVYNENYQQPAMPAGVEEGIVRGMYRVRRTEGDFAHRVQLLGSGPLLRAALASADLLAESLRRRCRRVECDELPATARRRPGRRAVEPSPPDRSGAAALRDGRSGADGRTDRRHVGLGAARPRHGGALRPLRSGVHRPRHRRLRPFRHAASAPPPLRDRRRARGRRGPRCTGAPGISPGRDGGRGYSRPRHRSRRRRPDRALVAVPAGPLAPAREDLRTDEQLRQLGDPRFEVVQVELC